MKAHSPRRPSRAGLARLLALAGITLTILLGGRNVGVRAENSPPAGPPDALPFANGFLVTGDYVVSGVDLPKTGGMGTISLSDARLNGGIEVVAAYLYWETISRAPIEFSGVTYRGAPITGAKASTIQSLPGLPAASCWGAAGSGESSLTIFRADVLALLEKRLDFNGKWTGKYLVNDSDLVSVNKPLHTVTLPQQGTGNVLTQSAGATLLLVFRDLTQPLRKIVVYDGAYAQAQGTTMTQTIRGFYKSDARAGFKSAQITHIVGSGASNTNERLLFKGTNIATDPIPAPIDSGADRGWANPTRPVSSLMPGTDAHDGYGETVTTAVDHGQNNQNSTPYECLSWAATVFSTSVAAIDRDGLPDGLEDGSASLDPPTPTFPNGRPLPNLNTMGASIGPKDLFVEINAMWTAGATYGSADAPLNSTTNSIQDTVGHNHMPRPDVLKMVGLAFANNGVTVHFDVGENYHESQGYECPVGQTTCDAEFYLVPAAHARGGERIEERACDDEGTMNCQFPDYPGTVGWRLGVQLYKDSPVGNDGEELAPELVQDWGDGEHRRRFDRDRHDFFHYVLYAHARGKGKSDLPCVVNGLPAGYDHTNPNSCTLDNPQFHVPTSASGIADLPGNTALITLGLWDDFVGTEFMQASTTLHELGHNANLWHGGPPPIWGTTATPTVVEPNCKPNYLSSMSYLYQAHGLYDLSGNANIDFSRAAYGTTGSAVNEASVSDGSLSPEAPYQSAWYAPLFLGDPPALSALATILGVPASTRFCDGAKFDPLALPPPTGRLHPATPILSIDWNGDGINSPAASQDVNFNGTAASTLTGFNDLTGLRLDQIGAGLDVRIFPSTNGSGDFLDFGAGTRYIDFGTGDFLDFGSGDFLDFGSGDFLDFGSGVLLADMNGVQDASGDFLDFGAGDFLDFGSGDFLDFGSGDFLDFGAGDFLDFGSGDFLDFGAGDFLDFGAGSDGQELEFETVKAMGSTPPHGLKACVLGVDCGAGGTTPLHRTSLQWKAPTVGGVSEYLVYRLKGAAFTPAAQIVSVGSSSDMFFVDSEELPNGVQFTYFIKAQFDDGGISGASNFATITARNDAPVAVNESYSTNQDSQLVIDAPGVLANDTDVDSASKRVNTATIGAPSHGTLALTADGKVVYTPASGYQGSDSFTYKANNGTWSRDAGVVMSADSNLATVSIIVNGRPVANNDAYSTNPGTALVVPAPGVLGNDTDPEGNALT